MTWPMQTGRHIPFQSSWSQKIVDSDTFCVNSYGVRIFRNGLTVRLECLEERSGRYDLLQTFLPKQPIAGSDGLQFSAELLTVSVGRRVLPVTALGGSVRDRYADANYWIEIGTMPTLDFSVELAISWLRRDVSHASVSLPGEEIRVGAGRASMLWE